MKPTVQFVWGVMGGLICAAALHAQENITPVQQRQLEQAEELNQQVLELYGQRKLAEAVEPAEQMVKIRRDILGDEHVVTADSLFLLGLLHYQQDEFAKAETYFRQVLSIRKLVLGSEHPDTALVVNDLGLALSGQQKLDEAQSHFEQALEIRRKVLGHGHLDTATSLHELAHVHHHQQNHVTSQKYNEQALTIRRERLGSEHALTALSLNNLGTDFYFQDNFAAAQAYFQESFTIRQKVLGEDEPVTIITLANLIDALEKQAKYVPAESYQEQLLAIRRRVSGEQHPDTVNALTKLGELLQAQTEIDAAQARYEEALAIRRGLDGDDHPDTIRLINKIIVMLESHARYTEALPLQEEVVDHHRRMSGDESLEFAQELRYLGALLRNAGDHDAAHAKYKRSLAIIKQVAGDNDVELIDTLNEFIFLFEAKLDYSAAVEIQEQVIALHEKISGEQSQAVAEEVIYLGKIFVKQDEQQKARQQFLKGLETLRAVVPDDRTAQLDPLDWLASLSFTERKYDEAADYYRQAIEVAEQAGAERRLDLTNALSALGATLLAQGNWQEAGPILKRAQELGSQLTDEEQLDLSSLYVNLGHLRIAEADYAGARTFLEKALGMRRDQLGEEHLDTASSLVDVGIIYHIQKNLLRSQERYEQALITQRNLLGDEHPTVALTLDRLAAVLNEQGEKEKAQKLMEEALAIRQATLGDDHPDTAESHDSLGYLLAEANDVAAAQPHLKKALEIRRASLGERHPLTIASLNSMSFALRKAGEVESALTHAEQSLALSREVLGEEHYETSFPLYQLAVITGAQKKWAEATAYADNDRRIMRKHISRTLIGMSPREQLDYLKSDESSLHTGLSLGIAQREDPAIVAAAAEWLINGKGISQEALAAVTLLSRDLSDRDAKVISQKLQVTRQKLASLSLVAPQGPEAQQHRETMEALALEEQQLSRQVAHNLGAVSTLGQWVELDAVRQAIAPGDALITLARFSPYDFQILGEESPWEDPIYAAWIIPPAGQGEVRLVNLGLAEEIDTLVDTVRREIDEAGKSDGTIRTLGEPAADRKREEVFQEVTRRIWRPLAEQLPEETQRLALCPDGALWLLPWGAIEVEDNRFLIEKFPLRFVVSGRELISPKTEPSSNASLLFADPEFDLSPEKTRDAIRAVIQDYVFDENPLRGLVTETTLGRVAPLPSTRLEAVSISPSVAQIAGKPPTQYLGKYALESVLKRVRAPRILVISTHGFFLADQQTDEQDRSLQPLDTRSIDRSVGKPVENPLLRCGLMLAGCNQTAAAGDDGILTGMEIVGLDLRGTQLVVLSACQTGLGEIQQGEGVAGLRQAFQLAGAEGVVSTLWQVPDRDSAILMRDFFENLAQGQSQTDALRNAQLTRIESRRERFGAAHPFFWAAWTVTGKH